MERKDMQKSMYRQRRVVLAYLVAAVTIASAALAANTAIEPASNAGNTNWMARHQAMNARAKQGHVDLIEFIPIYGLRCLRGKETPALAVDPAPACGSARPRSWLSPV
jgi:hypothetical protein